MLKEGVARRRAVRAAAACGAAGAQLRFVAVRVPGVATCRKVLALVGPVEPTAAAPQMDLDVAAWAPAAARLRVVQDRPLVRQRLAFHLPSILRPSSPAPLATCLATVRGAALAVACPCAVCGGARARVLSRRGCSGLDVLRASFCVHWDGSATR